MAWIKYAAKALYTLVVTPLTALSAIMVGNVGFNEITQGQWITILAATVVAVGGVFGIRNGNRPN